MTRHVPLEPWTPETRHRPPHVFDRGMALFITAATYMRIPHLRAAERKDECLALLEERCQAFEVELWAWVELDDHYHVVVRPHAPDQVPEWLRSLHGRSSQSWNTLDEARGRRCWYQFWDTTLWTEGDLWSRVNYTHSNPVKHGYVSDPRSWCWSSFKVFDA